jgi:hypothetical protein
MAAQRRGWLRLAHSGAPSGQPNGRAFLKVKDLALDGKPLYGRMIGGQYAPTNGKSMWGLGADGGPTGDRTNWRESAPTTPGTWQCVEWRLAPQDNQVQAWFDGVDNPDLTANTSRHGGKDVPFVLPQVSTVKVGWQLYQGGTTPKEFDVWIDDVALANTRIGC